LDSRKLLVLLRYAKKLCPLVIRGEETVSKNRSAGRKDIPSLGKRKISSFRAKPGAFQGGKIELKRGFLSGEIDSYFYGNISEPLEQDE